MPSYQIIQFDHQVGAGVTGAWWASVRAVLKENSPLAPYCVANELICSQLGQLLGLPIPPCGLFVEPRNRARSPYFGTLSFNLNANSLPPADPDDCVRAYSNPAHPRLDLTAGVLLFDVWVANGDRHPANLALDTSVAPHQLHVFDHSHALFGRDAGQGGARLGRTRTALGIAESTDASGNRHCLLDAILTNAPFRLWLDRLRQVPDYVISDAVGRARDVNQITSAEAAVAVSFLQYRRTNLRDIICAHRDRFAGISDANWGPL
jgi:hypothetical protein